MINSIYNVNVKSNCHVEELLRHSKLFKKQESAENHINTVLEQILEKYNTASPSAYKEYQIKNMPYDNRLNPIHNKAASREVELVIEYKVMDRLFNERVLITLEELKLED